MMCRDHGFILDRGGTDNLAAQLHARSWRGGRGKDSPDFESARRAHDDAIVTLIFRRGTKASEVSPVPVTHQKFAFEHRYALGG
jgi:hypothetical protein